MKNITELEINSIKTVPELLDIWCDKHFYEGKVRFIYDGCADYDRYNNCYKKIMIVLKEGYFDESERNDPIRKENPWVKYFENRGNNWIYRFDANLRNETPWWMWCRIENLILPIFDSLKIEYQKSPLQYIAVVNLKKSKDNNGGNGSLEPNNDNPYSNNSRVQDYAIADKKLLKRQIELHNPDIILCGGTYEMLNVTGLLGNVVEKKYQFESIRGLRAIYNHEIVFDNKKKSITVVDMCHPTYSMSHRKVGLAIGAKL